MLRASESLWRLPARLGIAYCSLFLAWRACVLALSQAGCCTNSGFKVSTYLRILCLDTNAPESTYHSQKVFGDAKWEADLLYSLVPYNNWRIIHQIEPIGNTNQAPCRILFQAHLRKLNSTILSISQSLLDFMASQVLAKAS